MSVTLTISEKTYKKLQSEAETKGFQNVEQFLEKLADEKFYNAVRPDFPEIILLANWQ